MQLNLFILKQGKLLAKEMQYKTLTLKQSLDNYICITNFSLCILQKLQ